MSEQIDNIRHLRRLSGILMHPTSLPGEYGIGDLGPEAYRFVDFLREADQHLWQTLPLGRPEIPTVPTSAIHPLPASRC